MLYFAEEVLNMKDTGGIQSMSEAAFELLEVTEVINEFGHMVNMESLQFLHEEGETEEKKKFLARTKERVVKLGKWVAEKLRPVVNYVLGVLSRIISFATLQPKAPKAVGPLLKEMLGSVVEMVKVTEAETIDDTGVRKINQEADKFNKAIKKAREEVKTFNALPKEKREAQRLEFGLVKTVANTAKSAGEKLSKQLAEFEKEAKGQNLIKKGMNAAGIPTSLSKKINAFNAAVRAASNLGSFVAQVAGGDKKEDKKD